MAKRRVDTNPDLHKEQAEGDRETVEQALGGAAETPAGNEERTERTGAVPRPDVPGHAQQGVTNQPLEEEEEQQRQLPPRGSAKKRTPGGHA